MKSAVIFDVDGTLRSYGHRDHLVPADPTKDENWHEHAMNCHLETPSMFMIELVKQFQREGRHDVIFLTAASECSRVRNLEYFERFGVKPYQMIMRQEGDHRHPADMKEAALKMLRELGTEVVCVYDDDERNLEAAVRAGARMVCHVQLARGSGTLLKTDYHFPTYYKKELSA